MIQRGPLQTYPSHQQKNTTRWDEEHESTVTERSREARAFSSRPQLLHLTFTALVVLHQVLHVHRFCLALRLHIIHMDPSCRLVSGDTSSCSSRDELVKLACRDTFLEARVELFEGATLGLGEVEVSADSYQSLSRIATGLAYPKTPDMMAMVPKIQPTLLRSAAYGGSRRYGRMKETASFSSFPPQYKHSWLTKPGREDIRRRGERHCLFSHAAGDTSVVRERHFQDALTVYQPQWRKRRGLEQRLTSM